MTLLQEKQEGEDSYLFTSESVSEGHPDKVADQVSDAVLDICLREDPDSRVACETFTTTGMVLVGGEITTKATLDIQRIVRQTVREIGYTDPAFGLDADSMCVVNMLHSQSPDISQGVSEGEGLYAEQGAGDQGMMFGYACDETPELMPAPITYAHQILRRASALRKEEKIAWLRPDSKSQVCVRYVNGAPQRIDSVVVSHQHGPEVDYDEIKKTIIEEIINPTLESTGLLDEKTVYFVNPTGRFVVGGPHGDSGLTGRKIIVDTYGGVGRHGGGAFSGKDPSKVDRSGAYMARYVAKNLIAARLAKQAEVSLAYAIGVPFPVSVRVQTFGTSAVSEKKLTKAVRDVFDLTPGGIVRTLDLKRPIYRPTSTYGHFGRRDTDFPWERTDKANDLVTAMKGNGQLDAVAAQAA
ncbi:methionine adenosyltransferase [Desulfonatronum thioautotrophicum]|uniref:methionine adenosyltransferase n=1 Tax=Desulfonatronum thioautotrophicum TaxID=617001 RepID=UPI0005EB9FC2|nr:methionine adenosyltransferase [Desulfonatronum thioautotrophicum]